MGGEGLFVPKMHAVLHLLEYLVLFGAVDNARLGDQEKDHQPYVKKAVRRTRQWETTFEDEVLGVADRIDAMLQIRSEERAAFLALVRCKSAWEQHGKPLRNKQFCMVTSNVVLNQ